ncbi:MAG: hypothetical protein ANABAC_3237 [Anaerolineae bacterium]|jgi:hypothetical protein|nr:MAG: hypothetical protein ANABAC_3237 [Anaerolineae bacterium]
MNTAAWQKTNLPFERGAELLYAAFMQARGLAKHEDRRDS